MISAFKKFLFLFFVFTSTTIAAPVPQWEIVPSESKLTFTGIQNNAPTKGEFKKFTGDIRFDPQQLNASHVKIIVDVTSVYTSYSDLLDTLKTTDWFDVKDFPQAVFETQSITKTADKTYQAKGTLTIRDKSIPVTVDFTQEELTPTKARIKGTATIKRTQFGVGQGEWASTDEVKDDVKIDFDLSAIRK